jgi:tetratricopeptide (TPR) repeat protein
MIYFKNKPISILLLSSLLISTIASDIGAVENHIKYYGGLAKNYPYQAKVQEIFERVQKTAIHNEIARSKLHIVNGRPNDPFTAIALPEGDIILSIPVVEFIYKNVDEKQGHVRLAFILGHELAHVVHGDVSPEVFNALSASEKRKKERQADEQGFLYAAMAGYAVDELLKKNGENFFVTWIKETRWGLKTLDVEESAKGLHKRLHNLKKLLDNLPYFQFGIRLAHFDRCDDAIYFFKEFLTVFPSREVFNNLGLCELQRAQKELGDAAYSYWLPSVLEVASQLEDFELPSIPKGEELSMLARRFLNRAKGYFQSALDSDPLYLPTRLNLMTTTFYLGEIYEARVEIEKAHQLAPNDPEIQSWRAVILYEEGKQSSVDMWPDVIELLEKLQQPHLPPSALYNKARLLEERGRTGADKIWQQLAQVTDLPRPIRDIVCGKTTCPTLRRNRAHQAHWDLPVALGMRTRRNKTLAQWTQSKSVRLHDIDEKIYQHPNEGAEVLGLRNRVEMVVLKKLGQITVKDLPTYCRQPLRERRVVNGRLLSCESWAAWVVNNQIKEVWVIK